jgi:Fe-S-cluster-containing hydrogenase component 2
MIKIDHDKCCLKEGEACAANGGCAAICPVGAISRDKIVEVDNSLCINCGACLAACKRGAITMI